MSRKRSVIDRGVGLPAHPKEVEFAGISLSMQLRVVADKLYELEQELRRLRHNRQLAEQIIKTARCVCPPPSGKDGYKELERTCPVHGQAYRSAPVEDVT